MRANRLLPCSLALLLLCSSAWGARVKDISRLLEARHNQLLGYGLVVGLNGTGDSRQTGFTTQSLSAMLAHFGAQVSPATLRVKNVAAVIVTVDLPPFLRPGDRVDAVVSSIGDASSLQGGLLVQTPLVGADGQVYAVAQGPLSTNAFSAQASGSSVTKNHPTVGLISGGALIERAVPTTLATGEQLVFSLHQPDFATAQRFARAVNADLGLETAWADDAGRVTVRIPSAYQPRVPELVARLGELRVTPDITARVVVNERTGTVVVGGEVTILPVAAAHAGLTAEISTRNQIVPPPPLSPAPTVVVPESTVSVKEASAPLQELRGATVQELIRSLNAIKATPRDIIAILQAIKRAGALQAELEVI